MEKASQASGFQRVDSADDELLPRLLVYLFTTSPVFIIGGLNHFIICGSKHLQWYGSHSPCKNGTGGLDGQGSAAILQVQVKERKCHAQVTTSRDAWIETHSCVYDV